MPASDSVVGDARGVPQKEKKKTSIAVYIILAACVVFSLMATAISFISYTRYQEAFYAYSNELSLSANAQAAYVIDGDEVERFLQTLMVTPAYEAFAAKLDALRERINAAYFYILADTGVPGMYTYVYDATHSEEYAGMQYALGETESKDVYEGAEEVLATGRGFEEARYYNDYYGELYYAYAPIVNSNGKTVAFLGTDIDISPMHKQMQAYRTILAGTVLISIVVFAAVFYFLLRRALLRPMRNITENALRISRGDLRLSVDPKLLRRRNEMGQLASAFQIMTERVADLIHDIEHLMRSVRNGYLGERIDTAGYLGDNLRIVTGINETLDVVRRHFDEVPEAIAFMGPDLIVRHQNTAMKALAVQHGLRVDASTLLATVLSGGKHSELDEETLTFLQGVHNRPLQREIVLRSLKNEVLNTYAVLLLHTGAAMADGPKRGAPVQDASMMLMINDITTLTEAKNLAISANRAKSDFLSRMSHEIRTPMNAITGLSQIAMDAQDIQRIKEYLVKIEDSSEHLLGIINDILDFSKIEAGKLVLEESAFSLREDMEFVQTMIAPRAKERDITVCYEAVGLLHDGIVTDSLRLNQVLINLLSNAVKFSHEGGVVDLTVEEEAYADGMGTYRFTVRDYGIGIDEQQALRLFKPFEQADASVSRQYGGTGLGLAISKNIVEMMGGSIAVISRPGKGSSFTFTIQTRAMDHVEAGVAAGGQRASRSGMWDFTGKHALVVDDIEINREIILELLRESGLKMDTAEDGQQALEMFEASSVGYYDAILMDMQMPVMDGCAATEQIRALDRPDARTTKIIAMTANVMREDVERALAAGMDSHLGKPIDVRVMFDMLGEMMGVEPKEA